MALSDLRRYVHILIVFLLMGSASIFGSWQATSKALRDFEQKLQLMHSTAMVETASESQRRFFGSEELKSSNRSQSPPVVLPLLPLSTGGYHANKSDNVPSKLDAALSEKDSNQQSSALAVNSSSLVEEDISKSATKSSLDFVAQFGAGHRLNRMSMAHFVAEQMGVGFRIFWGVCLQKEIFKYLFGPKPLIDLNKVVSQGQFLLFTNIVVPGPENIRRFGTNASLECMCSSSSVQDKVQADVRLYRTMRDRFRARDRIEAFRQSHFANASLVIGMHIRAGNGEQDHFVEANRTIYNEDEWKRHVAEHVQSLATKWRRDAKDKERDISYTLRPVTLFIATDTPSMIQHFQRELQNDTIQVVEWIQERREDGGGVMFGAQKLHQKGDKCLPGWEATLADMILLSYADILVAPRSSSFTQTLPMSLAYADRQERLKSLESGSGSDFPPAFCEMNGEATEMQCFDTFVDWCCKGSTDFVGREHLEIPDRNFTSLQYQLSPRPNDTSKCIGKRFGSRFEVNCLPFDYSQKGW